MDRAGNRLAARLREGRSTLEKLVYALWPDPAPAPGAADDTSRRLLGEVAGALCAQGAQKLKIALADIPPPENDPYTAMKAGGPTAILSFWLNAAAFHAPFTAIVARAVPKLAAYATAESVILPMRDPVPDGTRDPGATQIALFGGHRHMSRAAILDHWMHHHANVAVETQTTSYYCQNIITRPLTAGAPEWDGIVEETFPLAALSDPAIYYAAEGDPEKQAANIAAMNASCAAFIDFTNIKLMMAGEYRFGGWHDLPFGWHEHGRL